MLLPTNTATGKTDPNGGDVVKRVFNATTMFGNVGSIPFAVMIAMSTSVAPFKDDPTSEGNSGFK